MGKRSALLDLRRGENRAIARDLAATADVILLGYRPGALARSGFGADELARAAPHAVIAQLSAWGESGPWSERAGFDSIVQAASGIAVMCGDRRGPRALPVQALDLATGHVLAAEVLDALAEARARTVNLSLLGAAEALCALPQPEQGEGTGPAALEVPRAQVRAGEQVLDVVPPVLRLDGQDLARGVGVYGAAAPVWRD